MALQVLAGIPWLAGILGSIFTGLLTFLSQYATKRVALVGSFIIAVGVVTTGFFAVLEGLIQAITVVAPTGFLESFALFLPHNTTACISAILAAKLARWVYDWNIKVIQMKLF
jgi:uncharacterized membrane protein YjjP (DUF1212 family)